ncbi:MAG: ComEC/Rec2 family competence protein [Saprospiraceae bacterium]|nr:ComEC/Rec2 family competence protein [Candidatus Opimibacter iunctus]
MQGVLIVTEVLKDKGTSVSLRCRQLNLSSVEKGNPTSLKDKFIVAQLKEPGPEPFFPGDRIQVEGLVSAVKGPVNPHAFDVRTYYQSIGIRHQLNGKAGQFTRLHDPVKSLLRLTAKWQFTLCSVISQHTSIEVAQLTNALVWGQRTDMDEDIRQAFADSGAMHVLSVSGMHMAIIYSMLYLVLGAPGSGSYARRMARLGMYAMAIILYMGLTGACPAVVRSGLMILLYLLGKAMGWNTPIWNLLGFAAFVMLWINPFVWKNIGFQLSFLAMAGILLYAKPMIRYYAFKNKILHITWEVTAVSMAAQVFILPLLLHHFHQFPLTFIASSLVAMPASYVIIFGTLANTCLGFLNWEWLWHWYDTLCHYFLLIMKWMATLNPEMNYALPVLPGLMLSGITIFFSLALVYHWKPGKPLAYILGVATLVTLGCHRSAQWQTDELIIYHQYQGLLADIISRGQCVAIRDSNVTERSIDFAARGHRCFRDVKHTKLLYKNEMFISHDWQFKPFELQFYNSSIWIWGDSIALPDQLHSVTHLVIDSCPDLNKLKEYLCSNINVIVILPAHLKWNPKKSIIRFLNENDISMWDISEQGYYKLSP